MNLSDIKIDNRLLLIMLISIAILYVVSSLLSFFLKTPFIIIIGAALGYYVYTLESSTSS